MESVARPPDDAHVGHLRRGARPRRRCRAAAAALAHPPARPLAFPVPSRVSSPRTEPAGSGGRRGTSACETFEATPSPGRGEKRASAVGLQEPPEPSEGVQSRPEMAIYQDKRSKAVRSRPRMSAERWPWSAASEAIVRPAAPLTGRFGRRERSQPADLSPPSPNPLAVPVGCRVATGPLSSCPLQR